MGCSICTECVCHEFEFHRDFYNLNLLNYFFKIYFWSDFVKVEFSVNSESI